MFREMRRKDRELSIEETIEILKKCEYGILSTISKNEYPYGVPVNYIYMDNAIYFHCALSGEKIDNLTTNNKVSFCVVGNTELLPEKFSTKYESVVVFGRAEEVNEDEKYKVMIGILNKYSKEYMEPGKEHIREASKRAKVVKININKISGKARK